MIGKTVKLQTQKAQSWLSCDKYMMQRKIRLPQIMFYKVLSLEGYFHHTLSQ